MKRAWMSTAFAPSKGCKAALFLLFLLTAGALSGAPAYEEVAAKLPALWEERYPLPVPEFEPDPRKRGALRVFDKGKQVVYYHFQATLQQPFRDEEDHLQYKPGRKIEFWVRYRAHEEEPYDLSFVREDLLPGKGRRWIRP